MATSAVPRGKTIDVLMKAQSAFDTLPSGNWLKTYIYSHNLEEKNPFEDDELLGLARTNDRDTTAPAPGLPSMSGTLVVPVDFNHFGLWLKMLLGAAVDTGSADPYTHVFTSGAEVLPYNALEVSVKNVGGATKYMQYLGLIGSKGTIEISRQAGYQKASIEVMGRSELKAASTGGGTPADPWAREAIAATLGKLQIGGSDAANILKVSATYDNKPTAQDFLNGTGYPSGFDLDAAATFTGSIDLRFLNTTMYDHAVAGDVLDAAMVFSQSGSRSLTLEAPALRLERSGVPISGPAGIQQSFNFRAEQSASAAMLTATLKSLVPSY
jgi:hypothetical protein